LAAYFGLLVVGNVIVLLVYRYYKNQEVNVIGLLAYMNVKEIRNAVSRFKMLRELLKSK